MFITSILFVVLSKKARGLFSRAYVVNTLTKRKDAIKMPKIRRNPEGFTEEEQEKFLEQSFLVQWDGFEIERARFDDGLAQVRTKTRTFEEKTFFPYAPGFYSYRRTLLKEYHVKYLDGDLKGKVERYVEKDHHHINGQVHKNGSITFYPVDDENE